MEQTRLLRARTVARCLAPNNLYCVGTADSDVLRQTIDNAVRYEAHFLEVYSSDILDPALASDISYAHQRLSRGRPVRRIAPRVSRSLLPVGVGRPEPALLRYWNRRFSTLLDAGRTDAFRERPP